MLIETNYNPDVLSCLANLSSDGVFTPPDVANQVLDLLPDELWSNPAATFLDPCCKSGVFLREIAKRLNNGLEKKIPDQEKRINHIFTKQIYGIGITNITSLLARRSVYCSKSADGKYSIANGFDSNQGNIIFNPLEHTWNNDRCVYCGASAKKDLGYSRSSDYESHAYHFIHTNSPQEIFKVNFDVIIGNPPYHLSDAGHGRSARPIYHLFVEQAKKLKPRHIVMIIPSRWYAGGKGLADFRSTMLDDTQLRTIVDFEDSSTVFPEADVPGGICYFHWERDSKGISTVINETPKGRITAQRSLNEFSVFVSDNSAMSILHKALKLGGRFLSDTVEGRKPFGLPTNWSPRGKGEVLVRWRSGKSSISRDAITTGHESIDRWKVITSKASFDHAGQPDKHGYRKVFSFTEVLPPPSACTETYIVTGSFDNEVEAQRFKSYLDTKPVRFLISLMMVSQDITRDRFRFVPRPPLDRAWDDESVYEWLGLTADETHYIESRIRELQ